MSNRKKVENACKELGLTLEMFEYERQGIDSFWTICLGWHKDTVLPHFWDKSLKYEGFSPYNIDEFIEELHSSFEEVEI